MDLGLVAQYLLNGIVLGVIYSMVAVGFTLFLAYLTSSSSRTGMS